MYIEVAQYFIRYANHRGVVPVHILNVSSTKLRAYKTNTSIFFNSNLFISTKVILICLKSNNCKPVARQDYKSKLNLYLIKGFNCQKKNHYKGYSS